MPRTITFARSRQTAPCRLRQQRRRGTTRNDIFSYNDRRELIAATMGANAYAFGFDNIGTRTTTTELNQITSYQTNALNQYTSIASVPPVPAVPFAPQFDLNGNQTKLLSSTGIWDVEYNAKNRPTKFTQGTTIIACKYNFAGARAETKITTNGAITKHERYVNRGYLLIACLDLTRPTQNDLYLILWNPTQPIATRPLAIQKGGTWYTFGHDLTKNITETFTNTGTIASTYLYSPFGAVTATGTFTQPIQFSSEFFDAELGLTYYFFRHYNSKDGRWISRDFIGERGGYNLYSFLNNGFGVDLFGLYFPSLSDVASGAPGVNPDQYTQVNSQVAAMVGNAGSAAVNVVSNVASIANSAGNALGDIVPPQPPAPPSTQPLAIPFPKIVGLALLLNAIGDAIASAKEIGNQHLQAHLGRLIVVRAREYCKQEKEAQKICGKACCKLSILAEFANEVVHRVVDFDIELLEGSCANVQKSTKKWIFGPPMQTKTVVEEI